MECKKRLSTLPALDDLGRYSSESCCLYRTTGPRYKRLRQRTFGPPSHDEPDLLKSLTFASLTKDTAGKSNEGLEKCREIVRMVEEHLDSVDVIL